MNLSQAHLCLDCSEIHDSLTCPKCASRQWFPIAKWLERECKEPDVVELERMYRLKSANGNS